MTKTKTIRWRRDGGAGLVAELPDRNGKQLRARVFRWTSRADSQPWTFEIIRLGGGRALFDGDELYSRQADAKLAAADELAELAYGFADSGWLDPLDDERDGYAAWLRELKDTRGCYAIRAPRGPTICYVGSSRKGRLYSTITRHFQEWADTYGSAGWTADPHGMEVRVWTLGDVDRSSRRIDSEAERLVLQKERELIRQYLPVVNIDGKEATDHGDVPF